MSHVRIVVDGEIWMDGDTGEWDRKTPDKLRELQARTNPEPWMKSLMIVMTESVVVGQSVRIDITTRRGGWAMNVDHAVARND